MAGHNRLHEFKCMLHLQKRHIYFQQPQFQKFKSAIQKYWIFNNSRIANLGMLNADNVEKQY